MPCIPGFCRPLWPTGGNTATGSAHGAIDRLRRDHRYEAVPLEEAIDDLAVDATDADPLLERRLRLLLQQLSPAPRAVLLLHYQEDLEPAEIARTLSMSINTVESHLKRSLAMLRECIGAAVDARERLLKEFREDGNDVLLGTTSFWEGVDVKGEALRLVIIEKLPSVTIWTRACGRHSGLSIRASKPVCAVRGAGVRSVRGA